MHLLHLPRLGQTMERGTVEAWLVREGQAVAIDDLVYRVQTDKVDVEVEAKLPGTIARIVLQPGEEVEVGTLLAVVADVGEVLDAAAIDAAIAADRAAGAAAAAALRPAAAVVGGGPTGGGAPGERADGRVKAMPKARQRAEALGVELPAIVGTGAGGVITVEDVEAAAAVAVAAATSPIAQAGGPAVLERRPVRGIARGMADAVTRSWAEVPQFVQQVSLDASGLRARRERLRGPIRDAHGVDLTFTDLLVDAVVQAVAEVPEANASFAGSEIVVYADVNVGVAVATDAGLVVPVLQRAQAMPLGERVAALHALAERARRGQLDLGDVSGATITVSNLGMYGIDSGTPLVPVPSAVIVFAGTMAERPWVVDGALAVRPVLGIANGFDHRVLDGATAASFTAALKAALTAA